MFYRLSLTRAALLAATVSVTIAPLALADELAERSQASKKVIKAFAKELGGELKKAMTSGGPASAISVCQQVAPVSANRLSLENGWKITRVGTKIRNSMIGTPDPWEQATLDKFLTRAANGEAYKTMDHAEIVEEGDRRYFRYMKAIPVAEVCLTCHGSAKQIPQEVKDSLDSAYPHDMATDYQLGDLRSAFSIKQPL